MFDYFEQSFAHLGVEKANYLETSRARLQYIRLKVITLMGFIFTLAMVPMDFSSFANTFSKAWVNGYLFFIFLVLLTVVVSYFIIRKQIKLNEFDLHLIKKLLFWNVVSLSLVNIAITMIGRYFGSDVIGLIYAPCVFSTSFLLRRTDRFIFLIIYLLLSTFCSVYFLNLSAYRNFDSMFTLTGACVLFYIIGDFVSHSWKTNNMQRYDNELIINELAQKNKQQKQTFDALTVAFQEFDVNQEENQAANSSNESIEKRTSYLLKEFTNTQKLFKQTLQRYEDIFANVNDGIVILDENGTVVAINDAAKEILEIPEDMSLSALSLGSLVYEKDKEKSAKYIQQLINEGSYKAYEGRVVTPKGNLKYIEVSSTSIIKNGKFGGSRDIIRDVSLRKEAEYQIEKARNAEKQFLANMSHEIRTPLNAIIGMSHLLYDTKPSSEQLEYLDILKNSANFLLALITDILDMAKIESGKMELYSKPFNLKSLLKTIGKTFQLKLEKKPIRLNVLIDDKLEGIWLGDELILNQILYNLLSNAEKFTETGEINLRVSLQSKESNDKYWIEFKVSDTGLGMPHDKLEIIFEKFTQLHNKNTQKQKGTGLGLALCKEFVGMQGGSIKAESELGVGTTFTFVLPFEKVIKEQKQELVDNRKYEPQESNRNYKLLVVEDNLFNRTFVGKLLERNGLDYDFAFDGKEAIEKADQHKYDVILMDVEMPILDGYEATIFIRNTENPNKNTAIIALTASAMATHREKAIEVGMNDFISKPFSPEQLLETLRKNIDF